MRLESIAKAFPDLSLPDLGQFYVHIGKMRDIYMLRPPWRFAKRGGLYSKGDRVIQMLGAAKVLCDEFSALTFSEQVNIDVSDQAYSDYLQDTLQRCGFWRNFPDFLSRAYALGGGPIKCFVADSKPALAFLTGDAFLPTGWDTERITEGVFESVSRSGGLWYTLLEHHSLQNGRVRVDFALFASHSRGSLGEPRPLAELYPYLPDFVEYETATPMFCYFRPAVSNNVELDGPLGMSVYAGALDTLQALDTAFDSLHREFILGKKRIIVPAGCIRYVVDPDTGKQRRYFDADDEAFVAFKAEDAQDLQITDNTVELRVEEHVAAINALLGLLCFQTGLSAGTLSFDQAVGVKTATEVVSQNSRTERTVKAHKNMVTELLETLAHSIFALGVSLGDLPTREYKVTVSWPDNIIVDDNTMIDNNVKLVSAGLKSKLKAIMEVQKCNEEEAARELERIRRESTFDGTPEDWFGGDVNDAGAVAGAGPAGR